MIVKEEINFTAVAQYFELIYQINNQSVMLLN